MSIPATIDLPGVLVRLQDPATVTSLQKLLDRLELVNALLDGVQPLLALAEQAPGVLAMAADAADELAADAAGQGVDLERGLIQGASAALRLGATMDAERVRSIETLLKSDVLDPAALQIVGELGRALAAGAADGPRRIGALELLKALRNPDVQRALGFLVSFAARFGAALHRPHSAGTAK